MVDYVDSKSSCAISLTIKASETPKDVLSVA